MKYCKEWKKKVSELDPILQAHCISYKLWKKKIKRSNLDLIELQKECQSVARFVQLERKHRQIFKCLCFKREPLASVDGLYRFVQLNKTCVYKLCKKIDKATNTNIALQWMRTHNVFDPCSCKQLQLALDPECRTCPVCLEDERETLFIYGCGHVVCTTCFELLYHLKGRKGTVHNLLGSMHRNLCCPTCRQVTHRNTIGNTNVWPIEKAYGFLQKIDHD